MTGSKLQEAFDRIAAQIDPANVPDDEEVEAVVQIEPIGEPEPHDEDKEVEAEISVEPIGEPEPELTEQTTDPVLRPSHYADKQIEVIDYTRDTLTADEFVGFCGGNVLKYVSRWRKKGGVEDLRKAQVYLRWMIEAQEKGEAACPST